MSNNSLLSENQSVYLKPAEASSKHLTLISTKTLDRGCSLSASLLGLSKVQFRGI